MVDIHEGFVQLKTVPMIYVSMVNSTISLKMLGHCLIDFELNSRIYHNMKVFVMDNQCTDVIFGQDFLNKHERFVFNFGGKEPSLHVCALSAMNITSPTWFNSVDKDCKPVAVKSGIQTNESYEFISSETNKL